MNPDEPYPAVRIAEALESIAKSLEKLANPLYEVTEKFEGTEIPHRA